MWGVGNQPAPHTHRKVKEQHHVSIRNRAITILAVLGIALSSVVTMSGTAHAAGNGQFPLAPTGSGGSTPRDWFEYTMRPGQVLRDMVTVSNLTPNPLHFAIYPADA